MTYLPPGIAIPLALLVLVAGYWDVRWRRIPNWLTVSGVLVGIALNSFLYGLPGLWLSLKGLGLAMAIYFPLYALRAMGAGDVKLMAAVGALVGLWNWLGIFMITALLGGVLAIVVIVVRSRIRKTASNIGFMLMELAYGRAPYLGNEELDVSNPRAARLPHGFVIALGSLGFLVAAAIWAPR